MKKILNTVFLILKFILLIISFGMSLYIVFSMYSRVGKNFTESIPIFIPYVIILMFFFMNITFRQKQVNNNIFYNLTCCLVFVSICLVCFRAILDKNMLLNEIMGYNINFSYFADFITFMKIMLYGLIISNILFMIKFKQKKKIESNVEVSKKIEVL